MQILSHPQQNQKHQVLVLSVLCNCLYIESETSNAVV